MKRHLIYTLLVALLFVGCGGVAPKTMKKEDLIIYEAAEACDVNDEKAKKKSEKNFIKETNLLKILPYTHTESVDRADKFCYKTVIFEKDWNHYLKAFETEREEIVQYFNEQNCSVALSDKEDVIEKLVNESTEFNHNLENLQKIKSVEVEPLQVDPQTLDLRLNARPTVQIKVLSCKNRSNYQCQMTFISQVKDEKEGFDYFWEFGDGSTSRHRNPLYTYANAGNYVVKLHVKDSGGALTIAQKRVKVSPLLKPTALFSTKKEKYATYENILFNNYSNTQISKIVSYRWNFDDGVRSRKKNPQHMYRKAGTYFVKLKVCSANKQCSSASKKLLIFKSKVTINVKLGTKIVSYIAKHGTPSKTIAKKKSSMAAYKYGNIWLLAKRGKIECAVEEEGLSINLLGQPKKCDWHQKHARQYMVKMK